jgi:hypothetical protein
VADEDARGPTPSTSRAAFVEAVGAAASDLEHGPRSELAEVEGVIEREIVGVPPQDPEMASRLRLLKGRIHTASERVRLVSQDLVNLQRRMGEESQWGGNHSPFRTA